MIAMGAVIPHLVRWFGIQKMMAACAGMLSLILFLVSDLTHQGDSSLCIFLFSLLGIPWSLTMSLPYTMVSMLGREQERGKLMGMLNVFVVLPSFVILSLVGVTNMKSNAILNVGAVISAVATLSCITIPIHHSTMK